jgi:hypothetical protein
MPIKRICQDTEECMSTCSAPRHPIDTATPAAVYSIPSHVHWPETVAGVARDCFQISKDIQGLRGPRTIQGPGHENKKDEQIFVLTDFLVPFNFHGNAFTGTIID